MANTAAHSVLLDRKWAEKAIRLPFFTKRNDSFSMQHCRLSFGVE
jgi:hypothetical protein